MEDRLVADIKKDLGGESFSLSDLAKRLHEKVDDKNLDMLTTCWTVTAQLRSQSAQLPPAQSRPQGSLPQHLRQACLRYYESFGPREQGFSLYTCHS